MTKQTYLHILAISLIAVLLVPVIGAAHKLEDLAPAEKGRAEKVHKIIEVLYGLDPKGKDDVVHESAKHDYNNYGEPGKRYIDTHPGYDVRNYDDDAKFYSLTEGVVIKIQIKNPDQDLTYIAVYNEHDNRTILYVHPSSINTEEVKVDKEVKVGTYLGKQGFNRKFSTGPHIHLEVRKERWLYPSKGIEHARDNPEFPDNVDPIPYLYDHAKNYVKPAPPEEGADDNIFTTFFATLKSLFQ